MLEDHVRSPITRKRLRAGIAAPYIDDYGDWLKEQGYCYYPIRLKLRSLAAWTDWLRDHGLGMDDLRMGLDAYTAALHRRPKTRTGRVASAYSIVAARQFLQYLEVRGVLQGVPKPASPLETWPVLRAYRDWTKQQCGLTDNTLNNYLSVIVPLVRTLGDNPSTYTAENLRTFVFEAARPHGIGRAKSYVCAARSFIRFLIATGQCPEGLRHALPDFASQSLSSVPRFLPPEDVERLIAARAGTGAHALRDTAVLLLLARLGLRASEAAKLKFADIDWSNGRLAVCGKSRRREWLPLPQDVGDALLAYLERGRPPVKTPYVFLSTKAPIQPMTQVAVTKLVIHTIRRAGVDSPVHGAYVLRHAAATAMLRSGVSLAGVGAVLRHRSPITTLHYAKIDFGALAEVAQPWPGVSSC